MEINEKNILKTILKKKNFLEVDEILFQDLINVVREETFGNKVAKALNQRKQGHFDKAMLTLSEVNRDQVISIRAIQSIIDKIKGVSPTEVIFEKYRQFYPFQIGLKNGEDVLELLSIIKLGSDCTFDEFVTDLHKNEEMVDSMLEELKFYETRMKGRISEEDVNQLKRNIENITKKVFEIKTSLIDCVCGVVQEKYSQITMVDKISLVKSLYLILSSSIQTLDAKFVETEQNA